jgi:hypothetical protein
MKKAITVLLSITLIGISILSSTFTVQGTQNEGAWMLVEVIDKDCAEDIAKHNKDYEDVYHMEGSYSEGIFSLSSTYIGPSDDYYDPPKIHGEFLAFTAYFSSPPQVIASNDEITINILLSASDNHSFYNPFASVKARIGKNDQAYSRFTNTEGEDSFRSDIHNNYASIDENVTAVAPSGSEGDTLEIGFTLYFGVNMETWYVYEWKEGDDTKLETEQPTATIEPTSTIGPTPTACPANTEEEKLNYILNLYTTRIPKGIASSGPKNNLQFEIDTKVKGIPEHGSKYDKYRCGGYQSLVLNLLNGLKFSKDPCERQLLDNWDYGPIQAWFGGHQAVVFYHKNLPWQMGSIVLDPWLTQTPKTYSFDNWASRFILPSIPDATWFGQGELVDDLMPSYPGIGPSEVFRDDFNKYPIFGNDYEDTKEEDQYIRFTPEESQYVNNLSPEKRAAFDKMSKSEKKQWLKHAMQGYDKIQKVIAQCPLNLYLMDASGNRSGLSGKEILKELPNVSFIILELTDGTNYTEMTYPENAGYTLVLEGTGEGQAHVWQGHTLLLGDTPPPVQQYSFSVSKDEIYQITTDRLGAPMQWDGGSLAPEPVTEISEAFLESLPGLLLPEALDPDNMENEINVNIDAPENESENSTNIWIFLLCGLAIFCFLLAIGLVLVFFVLRKKNKGNQ